MGKEKIVIGKEKKEKDQDIRGRVADAGSIPQNPGQIPDQMPPQEQPPIPLDEDVWGSDHKMLNRLTKEQLAERRLFVRVRFMQRIECKTIYDCVNEELVPLPKPILFTIIDLSLSGIGIVCEDYINIGEILVYKIYLDNITYEIMCEVIYCFENNDKFRAGLRILKKKKDFFKHLKILVARISLQGM